MIISCGLVGFPSLRNDILRHCHSIGYSYNYITPLCGEQRWSLLSVCIVCIHLRIKVTCLYVAVLSSGVAIKIRVVLLTTAKSKIYLHCPDLNHSQSCANTMYATTHTDIHECMEGGVSCAQNGVCTDNEGSYDCSCAQGFIGDGTINCTGKLLGLVYSYDAFLKAYTKVVSQITGNIFGIIILFY